MAWIELHENFPGHKKVWRLAEKMNVSRNEARGIIISLWCWATSNATDGNITDISVCELSHICDHSATDIQDAMVAVGILDYKRGKILIHDWEKHGIRILQQSRARLRKYRERVDLEGTPETFQKDSGTVAETPFLPSLSPSLSPSKDKDSLHAPRTSAGNIIELYAKDDIYRPDAEELKMFSLDIDAMIRAENETRKQNPFVWNSKTGSLNGDLKTLVYKLSDAEKEKILTEAANLLSGKWNWLKYLRLAILYTMCASVKTKIQSPLAFTMRIIQTPHKLIGAIDGILKGNL